MAEPNTTDKQIANPDKPEEQIDNPDYKKPEPSTPQAAEANLDLNKPEPTVVVGTTGNVAIDAVGKLLADKKVPNADSIISEFAKEGSLSITAQAALVDSLGDSLATLAINQLNNEATKLREVNNKSRTDTLDYAVKIFGETDADATWSAIKDFVNSSNSGFTADDRTELTKMLQKGGLSARLALDNIHAVHSGNPNTTTQADLLQGDTMTSNGFTPVSSQSYSEQVSKLADKHGYDSIEVRQLQQQRQRSRDAGFA